MFRRSDSHNSNPSVRSSRLFDDSKEETISRIEFPLKQEINVLNNKLEKVNHKYTQVAEDRKKYIEQITLLAGQLKHLSEDNKSLKDTIAQIDEENKSLRHFISNENVQRNKKTKNPNKYKNDIDGIKQEINQFSSEFNLQGKIVDKCLESLENNLDCGFEIKSLVSNYIENSKITDFQIKRLHSNVNNFCNRQYSYQGSVLLKKASDLPSPKDGNTKNMPSLFDELNLVSNKHNITILDNELSENIMERLSTIEKDLEEIKEISDKSNKSPKKSSTNYPKTFKNLALSHSIPFLKI